jgi:hypothetical protein
VALSAEKVRALVNREVIFCAAGVLSASPLTYFMRQGRPISRSVLPVGDSRSEAKVSPTIGSAFARFKRRHPHALHDCLHIALPIYSCFYRFLFFFYPGATLTCSIIVGI